MDREITAVGQHRRAERKQGQVEAEPGFNSKILKHRCDRKTLESATETGESLVEGIRSHTCNFSLNQTEKFESLDKSMQE